jgi:Mg-chelatase subunit ChlD/tetratricopeptide (TPR) repeat protein
MPLDLAPIRTSAVRTVLGLVIAALLAVLGGLWLLSKHQVAPKTSATIEARIELAAGTVNLERNGHRERANSGTPLPPDSLIETGPAARALLRLQDGSVAFVRDATKVLLENRGLSLVSGEVFINAAPAEQKAQVHHTGDVLVSASDAGYSLSRASDLTTLTVTRGTATITSAGGRVEVQAGQQATVSGKNAPKTGPVAYFDDWTGGMADLPAQATTGGIGAGTIYGVDTNRQAGSVPQRLEIQKQSVRAVLRDELAETEVDQTFFNPGEHAVEGWYWFVVPEAASVTGFALETDNVLVEGELIERKEAAAQYQAARSSGHSPAILEWINERTVRARIFPIPSGGTRRVVIRYVELKPIVDGKLSYLYPMGSGESTRVGEFSLSVDLGALGRRMQIATLAEARIEDGGEKVTVRRSGYTPRAPFQLEATLKEPRPALSVARFAAGGDSADYVLARYTPDVDWTSAQSSRADVVVVVDTSGAGDESSRGLKVGVAEAIMRALSGEDRFALVSLDVQPKVLFPANGLSAASPDFVSQALQRLAEHANGGATDLGASFDVALERLHGADQPAVVLISDGIPTSGELLPEKLIERLRRALETSRARVFTVGVGADARPSLLEALARVGGGQSILLGSNDETTLKALELTAAIRTPTLTDLEIDLGAGLDDTVSNVTGKLTQGQEYLLLARTHHDLPKTASVRGRIAGKDFKRNYAIERDKGPLSSHAPRLWAAEQIRRMLANARNPDEQRGRVIALGLEYGLMTPFTSFLALETEAAYAQMGITRKSSNLRPARLASLSESADGAPSNPGSILPLFVGCSREEPSEKASNSGNASEARARSNEGTPSQLDSRESASPKQAATGDRMARSQVSSDIRSFGLVAGARPAEGFDGITDARKTGQASADAPLRGLKGMGIAPHREPTATSPAAPPPGQSAPVEISDKKKSAERLEQKKPAEASSNASETEASSRVSKIVLGTCSDLSKRTLSDRVVFWYKRLVTAQGAQELLERYDTAKRSCELSDWLAERTFLGLLEARLTNEGDVRLILNHFADQPDIRNFIASRLLRRSMDPRIAAAVREVLFGNAVDWLAVDRQLQGTQEPEKKLLLLRKAIAKAPADPEGNLRLLRQLVRAGHTSEALELGRRIKDSGLFTPEMVRRVGDMLTRDHQTEQAQRIYSELVEFAPDDRGARQMLGDIYLANHWFDPAYRQYQLLTELAPETPLFWLRLATAAAGAGRTDEALRIERRVSAAEGMPGPNDPRRFARLLATNQLASLLVDAQKQSGDARVSHRIDAINRDLKELSLFGSPGRLILVSWLDPTADLLLTMLADKEPAGIGEVTDAAGIGLQAAWLSAADSTRTKIHLIRRSILSEQALDVAVTVIDWNGKSFQVEKRTLSLPSDATSVDG